MNKYPTTENESIRVRKLHSYNILDSPAEDIFDDLTKMVSKLLNVPIVLITLVDKERQWFKSKVGLDADETPREISFCQHAILQDQIFEVENAHDDERFKKNPLVTGNPNIAFYAGAPLTDNEGLNMGTLCAIDTTPRNLSEFERGILNTVSKTIMSLIEFRKKEEEHVIFRRFFDITLDMLCVWKVAKELSQQNFGIDMKVGDDVLQYVPANFLKLFNENFDLALNGNIIKIEENYNTPNEEIHWYEFLFYPVFDNSNKIIGVVINSTSIEERKKAEFKVLGQY
jgi:PAS domain-containing protein